MLPTAITGSSTRKPSSIFWNRTTSPCCEDMSSILNLSTLSNVTLVTESNRPLWKCGVTIAGSEPSDRISSSVGSETK